ncbi:ankyrin repeat-containing domain protein [Aspergillus granulosus]|uniref:Ankyrin repeat-containing domain protein n=1 Tax=Aspergillus granulosus TaxID=176169 RepID=A0ABR4H3F2_9EURO
MAQPPLTEGLGGLPPEIMHLIAQQIASDRVLNALARTNRYFYEIFNPYLYAHKATWKGRRSALIWAAKEGREETMRIALRYHNPLRKTKPLVIAVENNRERIVEMLLAKDRVNIEALNSNKSTPLEVAVQNGFESIVKQLLDAGANVQPWKTTREMQTGDGESLLFQAIRSGRQGVARHLIHCGKIDLNAMNHFNETALTTAVWNDRNEVIEHLLAAGANPNTAGPLAVAVERKKVSLIRLLLDYGANPNEPNRSRRETPIYRAILAGFPPVLQVLLDCEKVDVNHVNILNDTPLTYAIERKKPDMANLLLCREDLCVNRGFPLDRAVRKGYTELVRALLNTGRLDGLSMIEGLASAVNTNNLDITLLVLGRKEVNINYRLPFRHAIRHGHLDIAKALLADGRLDQESKFEGLAAAISRNDAGSNMLIPLILDSGVDFNVKSGKYTLQTLLKDAYLVRNLKAVWHLTWRGVRS